MKIGFTFGNKENEVNERIVLTPVEEVTPKKSVVEVCFESFFKPLSYYNDKFDLQVGDIVYVDGKLEGQQGRVTKVNYCFKIKLSDYKRVVAVVDRTVNGEFYMAESHFITFDRNALPKEKAITWFKAPSNDEGFVTSTDEKAFSLENMLSELKVSPEVADRGWDYYAENKVKYISLDGEKGYAIVVGTEVYEVEFEYKDGMVKNLTCPCFCSYVCKHDVAAMLQLRELLKTIEESYLSKYESASYFSAILKGVLFKFAIDGNKKGGFKL